MPTDPRFRGLWWSPPVGKEGTAMRHGAVTSSRATEGDHSESAVAWTSSPATRLAGAARLDQAIYAEFADDPDATWSAIWLVTFLGVAHALAGVMRGFAFGWCPLEAAAFGMVGEIAFFVIASLTIFLLGRFVLGASATYRQVLARSPFQPRPGFSFSLRPYSLCC